MTPAARRPAASSPPVITIHQSAPRTVPHRAPCRLHLPVPPPPPPPPRSDVRQTTNFTYEGDTGPDFWGSLMPEFHACGDGRQQSPVDVAPAAVDSSWVEDSRPLQRRYAGSNLFNIVSRPGERAGVALRTAVHVE